MLAANMRNSMIFFLGHGGLKGVFVCGLAALIQQVMQLTPEQVAGLPPEQQAQVMALRDAVVSPFIQPKTKSLIILQLFLCGDHCIVAA